MGCRIRGGQAATAGECKKLRRQIAARIDNTVDAQRRVARSEQRKIRGCRVTHAAQTEFLSPDDAYADIPRDDDVSKYFRARRAEIQHRIHGMRLLLEMLDFGRCKATLSRIRTVADRHVPTADG